MLLSKHHPCAASASLWRFKAHHEVLACAGALGKGPPAEWECLVIDATGMEVNAAMKSVWRWKRGKTHQEVLERLAE